MRLPTLMSLSLKDSLFAPAPVSLLCNYSTHVLYHLPKLVKLDTYEVEKNMVELAEVSLDEYTYSRLSLSRLRLSRKTAYLEEKIRFKHRNLLSGNKILWIRGEIAPQEQFLPFFTIFSI